MELEAWLESQDITNADFARDMETSRQLVHLWVTRKQNPGLYWALKIELHTKGAVTLESWLTPEQRDGLDAMVAGITAKAKR